MQRAQQPLAEQGVGGRRVDAIVRAWLDATGALFLSWADYAAQVRR